MASANLTPRQLEILVAVVADMKPTEVDWDGIAGKANCKTGKYLRDQFNLIRKQLAACADSNGVGEGATPNSKPAKKTPASKRKKTTDEVDNREEESPTKKAKPAARKSKATTPAKSKSATLGESNVTPAAETNEDGEAEVKEEPNEAGEMMDAMNGGD